MKKLIAIASHLLLLSCTAGQPLAISNRELSPIIGGNNVATGDPISRFVVGLYDKKTRFVCTGSLIREDLILTAGHCIGSEAKNLVIIFGLDFSAYDLNYLAALRQAAAVKIHPDFDLQTTSQIDWNDIALIQFAGGIPQDYSPIQLLEAPTWLQPSAVVQMAGYGASAVSLEDYSGKRDQKFRRALDDGSIICYDKNLNQCYEITYLGSDRLRSTQATIEGLTKNEIRINESKGHGTCVGDSGGPLVMAIGNELKLIGVTSRGSQFCDGPAIYTNATKYLDWIKKTASEF